MKKIALYVRVSTEEQAQVKEGSLISQEQRLREYIDRRNEHELWGKVVAVFIEPGRSAKDTNRPELQKMILGIKQRLFDLIMVTELSRLSRSTKDFCNLLELFKKQECQILSLREQFDTTNAAGEMMMHMLMNFAQFERQQTAERLRANFRARAKRGLRNGGSSPLGYTFDPNHKGRLIVIDDEAKQVQECYQTFLREGSLSQAGKSLNKRGFSPRNIRIGGGFPRVGNKTFTVDSLQHILTNPVYIAKRTLEEDGKMNYYPAQWAPIIDEKIFYAVQEKLSSNKNRYKPDSYKRHPYILSGILECGVCNQPMVGKSAHGSTKKHFYYAHGSQLKRNSYTQNPGCHCPTGSLRAIPLEKKIITRLKELMHQPKVVSIFLDKVKESNNTSALEQKIKAQKSLLDQHQLKIESVLSHLEALPAGNKAHSLYDRLNSLEEQKRKFSEDLSRLETELLTQIEIVEPAIYIAFLNRLTAHLDSATAEFQRRLLRSAIRKIVVTKDEAEAYYYAAKETVERNWDLLRIDPSASPQDDLLKKNLNNSSNTLTNGRGGRI